MGESRIQNLGRSLVPGSSRRGLLAAIAGVLGGATGLLELNASAGNNKRKKRRKKQKRSSGSTCPTQQICTFTCDGVCTDYLNDEANCGACGRVCSRGRTCFNGGCAQTGCPGGCPPGCACLTQVATNSTVCGRSITCPTSGPFPQSCATNSDCPVGMGCVRGSCPANPGKPGLCTDFCQ